MRSVTLISFGGHFRMKVSVSETYNKMNRLHLSQSLSEYEEIQRLQKRSLLR